MRTNFAPLLASAALLVSASAMAQATPAVPAVPAHAASAYNPDLREANQQQRIQQGAAAGTLTHGEVQSLERGQARVNAREAELRADGKLSRNDQNHLQKMQARQSAKITAEKHDDDLRKRAEK